jgi:hypothetical protein
VNKESQTNSFYFLEFANSRNFSSDNTGEGRFLDQVQQFLARAAAKTDMDEDMYNLI